MNDYNFSIVTDSSADFSLEYYDELSVHVIPMHYTVDLKDYSDVFSQGEQKAFYDSMRAGAMPKTIQVSQDLYFELWEKLYLKGPILQICLSSGMSGTAGAANVAAELFCKKHPEAKILTVDSLGASVNQGLLVKFASHLREQNKSVSIEEIKSILDIAKLNAQVWYTVDDLEYLKRGGRLSSAAAFFGTLLAIKPVLSVDREGKLVAVEKLKGRKKALRRLYELYIENNKTPSSNTSNINYIKDIFIGHADCFEDAEILKNMLLEYDPKLEIKISQLGSIIGSHTGPGLVVFSFFGKERN